MNSSKKKESKVPAAPAASMATINTPEHLKQLTNGISSQLSNGNFSDFVIKCGERRFKVHKNILSIASSVFTEMFEQDMEVAASIELTLDDYKGPTVKEFLIFIYTGEVPDGGSLNPVDLYGLAATYKVEALKSFCREQILDDIAAFDAMDVLFMGNTHNDNELKEKAFARIKKMLAQPKLNDEMMNKPHEIKTIIDTKTSLMNK